MPPIGALADVARIAERFKPTLKEARFLVPPDKFAQVGRILGAITVESQRYRAEERRGEGCVPVSIETVPSHTVPRNIPWRVIDADRRFISVGPLLSEPHPEWLTTFWHDLPIDRIEEALRVRRLPGSRGVKVRLSHEDDSLTQLQVITRLLGGFMALGSVREWVSPNWERIAQGRKLVDSRVGAILKGATGFNLQASLAPVWSKRFDYAEEATLVTSGYKGELSLWVQNEPEMANSLDGWTALDGATERAVTALMEGNLRLRVASTPASSEPHLTIKVPDSEGRRAEILAGLGINEEGAPLNPTAG